MLFVFLPLLFMYTLLNVFIYKWQKSCINFLLGGSHHSPLEHIVHHSDFERINSTTSTLHLLCWNVPYRKKYFNLSTKCLAIRQFSRSFQLLYCIPKSWINYMRQLFHLKSNFLTQNKSAHIVHIYIKLLKFKSSKILPSVSKQNF